MAQRKCSCCGQSYSDEERHDYEQCVKDCERRLDWTRHQLVDAQECLENAKTRRQAQREGRIK
jgi:phage gp16-like protein